MNGSKRVMAAAAAAAVVVSAVVLMGGMKGDRCVSGAEIAVVLQ